MKKIISVLLLTLMCVTALMAKSSYTFDVSLSTKDITIVKDDTTISGQSHDASKAIALFRLTKDRGQVQIDLCDVNNIKISNLPNCTVSRDGTVRIGSFSIKITAAAKAFEEAMKYLDDSDVPIYVFLYE